LDVVSYSRGLADSELVEEESRIAVNQVERWTYTKNIILYEQHNCS